ncbi:ParA family protein [Candidatus Chlamydia sanziniae]|uniref:Septum site-determining protein MinD n=1 Tax=Candidatus Chlamydia sanziniae TaxID=1806891 RepID=A0A1A9HWV2_9CHLA|nr:ParA family protein [Candidatus Chlamydia sanziniae]ANH79177.1 Septum site-determining protein MinD [Candidatus Chlamydia sanziniae]
MKTIVFCSFKGGTGKTTLSLNIGSNLAQYNGKKVLLVDLDPQANLTTGLGIRSTSQYGLDNIFRNTAAIYDVIHSTKIENLDIIPSNILLESLRGINQDVSLTVHHLYLALERVKEKYDVCILDTPPSLGILTQEAFLAATHLVICLTPEPFSILGLQKIKEFCSTVNSGLSLEVLGVVLSFWNERNSTNVTYLNIIESIYKDKILSSKIRRDVALSRALLKETSVSNAYPSSRANKDILSLTKELGNKLFNTQ